MEAERFLTDTKMNPRSANIESDETLACDISSSHSNISHTFCAMGLRLNGRFFERLFTGYFNPGWSDSSYKYGDLLFFWSRVKKPIRSLGN